MKYATSLRTYAERFQCFKSTQQIFHDLGELDEAVEGTPGYAYLYGMDCFTVALCPRERGVWYDCGEEIGTFSTLLQAEEAIFDYAEATDGFIL